MDKKILRRKSGSGKLFFNFWQDSMQAPSLAVKNHSTCQRRAAAYIPTVMHSINIAEQREAESAPQEEKKRMV